MTLDIDQFEAEIRADNESYAAAGFINKASLYKWVYEALLPFGNLVTCKQDFIVNIKNGVGLLPTNFKSIKSAYLCQKKGYHCEEKDKKHLQQSSIWVERTIHSNSWDSCEPCCTTQTEQVIEERVYFEEAVGTFYYTNPQEITLGKPFIRNVGDNKYSEEFDSGQVYVRGNKMYSTFREADVYIIYYGVGVDEFGKPIIPESFNGAVYKYLEYYVNWMLTEKAMKNKKDPSAASLLPYWKGEASKWKGTAMTELKMNNINPTRLRQKQMLLNRAYSIMWEARYLTQNPNR